MNGNERERERLSAMYGEMGDGELLELFAKSGDLTEVAQAALAGEMHRRALKPTIEEDGEPESALTDKGKGWRTLHVFSQTFEAQAAFRLLERELIEFAIEDRTVDADGQTIAGPAVQLALMVEAEDWSRAVTVLRKEAGLFPDAVVDPRGSEMEGEEEGWLVVGDFEEEAELVKGEQMLREAGLELRVVRGEMAGGEAGTIEVHEADADRAIGVLERLIAEEED